MKPSVVVRFLQHLGVVGYPAPPNQSAAYWAGYKQGVRDAKAVQAAADADEAQGRRQGWPNE